LFPSTPPEDKVLRLIEHAAADFVTPQALGATFTRIEITLFAGRSRAAKRALYQAMVRNRAGFGMPPDDVKVVLVEVPTENVGIRGGKPASEVELGYEVRL
jgi:phenylpyruvate tautomerase PptA (4-oxalocrotonate tautomerase family)